MNLTIDPWIPVIGVDGQKRSISLQDLFAAAHEIRDLSVKPHEKIALLRLLICITQAALDGPANFDVWETCRDTIQPAVKGYLEKWRASFELFGDGPRFLQVPGLKIRGKDGGLSTTAKIDISLSAGNTATLFDNAGACERSIGHARSALNLLTFQCFSPGGLIGIADWDGKSTPGEGKSKHAPCTPASMLHTFLLGRCVLDTLHLNLVTKETTGDLPGSGWGTPVWEKPLESLVDAKAVKNATTSYLGRLVPISRAIRLDEGGYDTILGNGLYYPLYPIYRETHATFITATDAKGKSEIIPLGLSLDRSLWRQLASITIKRRATNDPISGPLPLNNLDGTRSVSIWIGALSTKQAKIKDLVESVYDIPTGMFRDTGRKLYEEGVNIAEQSAKMLNRSVIVYWTLRTRQAKEGNDVWQLFNNSSRSDKEHLRELGDRSEPYFWTAIEQYVPILLKLADKPEEAGDLKVSEWGKRVKEAAYAAFEFACPRQTPRQIQAYAIGLQQLFLPKPKDPNAPAKKKAPAKK
jgi:CRISPR system Cascade subunit CasA